jgi:hypothetical protein
MPVFTHGWDTALSSQFIDFGYELLSTEQANFVASHYSIVSLEKCTGRPSTEKGIWVTAAQLKAINPAIKVLFYLHTDLVSLECYDAFKEFMSRPEWWLRNDAGQPVNNSATSNIPVLDFTNAAARAWWVSIPLNGTNPSATLRQNIDGVFADGTGFLRCPGISVARCAALHESKRDMIREMQALLNATNGGLVFQNPPKDFELLRELGDAGAIMGEHFAAFEQVAKTGDKSFRYDATKIAAYMAAVARAAAANKTVVVATWPGPLSTPFTPNGFPSWVDGTQPTTIGGWKEPMAEFHAFALAGFLTMVEENVWMQYQVWYNGVSQGAISCGASTTCAAPAVWYPDLYKPLGRPLGPAIRSGNKWTRLFENAISVFDLDNPRRNGTNVTFFQPSMSATSTPSSSPSSSPSPSLLQTGSRVASASSSVALSPASLVSLSGSTSPSGRNSSAGGGPAGAGANAVASPNMVALAVTLPLFALLGLVGAFFIQRRVSALQHRKLARSVVAGDISSWRNPRSNSVLHSVLQCLAPPSAAKSIAAPEAAFEPDGAVVSENPAVAYLK